MDTIPFDPTQIVKAWPAQYIPSLDGQGFREPTPMQLNFCIHPAVDLLAGGAAGSGKLLAEDGVVLTPFGWKSCKDLKVGDRINSPNGTTQRVIQLKPWTTLPGVRVTFHDGTSTLVAWDHLWLSWRSGKRKKLPNGKSTFGQPSAEVIETRELNRWLQSALRQEAEGKRPNWPCIPVCQPQVFNYQAGYKTSLDPYKLGFWLGDGHWGSSNLGVTSVDDEHIRKNFPELKQEKDPTHWSLIGDHRKEWTKELTSLGLYKKKAWNKFIPKSLLYGSIETRTALLQGLMDADGTIDQKGHLSFCSTSKRLAKDCASLVQSLGGTATISEKAPFYRNKKGQKVYGRKAYTLYIKLRDSKSAFRLERKKSLCLPSDTPMYRRVVKIEEEGAVRGRCLTVSSPSGLYLTNDFIVTHNSDAMLMAALQYVEVPNYAAVIYRKSFSDLSKSGALLTRARSWLQPWVDAKIVKYNPQSHSFYWPQFNSTLEFGYIGKKGAAESVQGAEYHFVGIDEVTQHTKADAMWCRSRMRRNMDSDIPLRFRLTANPGNIGHEWVKEYFSIIRNPKWDPNVGRLVQGHFFSTAPMFIGGDPTKPFLPARLTDNPHIDPNYVDSLAHMDPLSKAQLLDGDWEASPSARFKRHWFNTRYTRIGNLLVINNKGYAIDNAPKFVTMDVAASVKDGVGGESFYVAGGGRRDVGDPCWSVMSVWTIIGNKLVLLDVTRVQAETPDLYKLMKDIQRKWKPYTFIIEGNGVGRPVMQQANHLGIPCEEIWTTHDKIVNSHAAANLAHEGRIIFPDESLKLPWLKTWESEIFTWVGFPDETNDQVDTLSNAAKRANIAMGPYRSNNLGKQYIPRSGSAPAFNINPHAASLQAATQRRGRNPFPRA